MQCHEVDYKIMQQAEGRRTVWPDVRPCRVHGWKWRLCPAVATWAPNRAASVSRLAAIRQVLAAIPPRGPAFSSRGFASQSRTLSHFAHPGDLEKAALDHPDLTFIA